MTIGISFFKSLGFSQRKRDLFSALVTLIVLAIFLVLFLFIPIENKKYKEISVHLVDDEIIEKEMPKQNEVPEVPPEVSTIQTEKRVVEKVVSQTQVQTQSAPQKTTTPVKNQTYTKSIEELMAENNAKTTKASSIDDANFDSMFDENFAENSSLSSTISEAKKTATKDAFSGTAATVGENSYKNNATITGDKKTAQNENASSVLESTQSNLSKIEGKTFSEHSTSSNLDYETHNFGAGRKLIHPEKPILTIPSELENLIDRTVTVTIFFTIDSTGFVDYDEIKLLPEQSLSPKIISEIKTQISSWLFTQGAGEATASFDYTIKVE